MSSPEINTTSGSAGPVIGMRSDVYERHWEITWMSKDDIETFETRLKDKALFKDLAILLLAGAIPLGVDKFLNYTAKHEETDLAICLVCGGAIVLGVVFGIIAAVRSSNVKTFKNELFHKERLVSSKITMVSSGSGSDLVTPLRAV